MTILGIDVGGTKTSLGVVQFPEGRVIARRMIATEPKRTSQLVLEDVVRAAVEVTQEASDAGRVSAVGLGICELVDRQGEIRSRHSLGWTAAQVAAALSRWGRVTIEADVRAAARAEALWGAGKTVPCFLYLTVGTGIACCLVQDGVPYLGASGATGTMASSPLRVPCSHCGAVNDKTLEDIAAGPALVARYNEISGRMTATGQEVLAAAATGDPEALQVVRTAGQALASATALLVNVLDPEAVIVGGGLGLSTGPFWDSFVAATRQHIWSDLHRGLPILRAATGVDAGLLGAAAAAWSRENGAEAG